MMHEDILSRTVRGQYAGYRTEKNVNPNSATETYVALKLNIDNWRWANVPFFLRTGKSMAQRMSEVVIQFKRAPFVLFRETRVEQLHRNALVLQIQPDEGITMSFQAKVPGPIVRLGEVNMSFKYSDYFGATPSTGYERLLYDCMTADATLFHRADMVEAGWTVVHPDPRRLEGAAAAQFPELRARIVGSQGSRRSARKRRPSLEEDLGDSGRRRRRDESQRGVL